MAPLGRSHIGGMANTRSGATHLGAFIELDVALRASQTAADGEVIARRLMKQLGVDRRALIAEAYVGLLLRSRSLTTAAV